MAYQSQVFDSIDYCIYEFIPKYMTLHSALFFMHTAEKMCNCYKKRAEAIATTRPFRTTYFVEDVPTTIWAYAWRDREGRQQCNLPAANYGVSECAGR